MLAPHETTRSAARRVTPSTMRSLMPAIRDEENECFLWNQRKCYEAMELDARQRRWETTYTVPDTDTYDSPVLDAVFMRLGRWLRSELFDVRPDATRIRSLIVCWDPARTLDSVSLQERQNPTSNAMIRLRMLHRNSTRNGESSNNIGGGSGAGGNSNNSRDFAGAGRSGRNAPTPFLYANPEQARFTQVNRNDETQMASSGAERATSDAFLRPAADSFLSANYNEQQPQQHPDAREMSPQHAMQPSWNDSAAAQQWLLSQWIETAQLQNARFQMQQDMLNKQMLEMQKQQREQQEKQFLPVKITHLAPVDSESRAVRAAQTAGASTLEKRASAAGAAAAVPDGEENDNDDDEKDQAEDDDVEEEEEEDGIEEDYDGVQHEEEEGEDK